MLVAINYNTHEMQKYLIFVIFFFCAGDWGCYSAKEAVQELPISVILLKDFVFVIILLYIQVDEFQLLNMFLFFFLDKKEPKNQGLIALAKNQVVLPEIKKLPPGEKIPALRQLLFLNGKRLDASQPDFLNANSIMPEKEL